MRPPRLSLSPQTAFQSAETQPAPPYACAPCDATVAATLAARACAERSASCRRRRGRPSPTQIARSGLAMLAQEPHRTTRHCGYLKSGAPPGSAPSRSLWPPQPHGLRTLTRTGGRSRAPEEPICARRADLSGDVRCVRSVLWNVSADCPSGVGWALDRFSAPCVRETSTPSLLGGVVMPNGPLLRT